MSQPSIIYIASDHAGLSLKTAIKQELSMFTFEDLGTTSETSSDYPDFAHALCEKVLETGNFGILLCGTGIGMSMAANRHAGIRAALCTHEFHAQACRAHNNANVLCLGARVTAPGLASLMTKIFIETPFEAERHARRVQLIEKS